MPELPEVERARQVVERAVGRRIVGVEDADTYVARPHPPGEIAAALTGHTIASAHRRGKTMWLHTVDGPTLGLHLGMAGRIVLDEPPHPVWDRFALLFEDGGRLALRDKRRLGRAILEPDLTRLGPDAAEITRQQFRDRVGRGTIPIKARLLDQSAIAGVGNLLADETLWQARIDPRRPADTLTADELDHLRRAMRRATRNAILNGGVHTGDVMPARHRGGACPRCGTPMERATVGGRTTYWCPAEQH
jgi:formamidopyrimidine-DNA glycosylase